MKMCYYKYEMIYFIRQENTGFVKIGYSANPVKRLSTLQVANPNKLYILGIAKGNVDDEWAYQKRYFEYFVRGEWFDLPDDIIKRIEKWIPCCEKGDIQPSKQTRQILPSDKRLTLKQTNAEKRINIILDIIELGEAEAWVEKKETL